MLEMPLPAGHVFSIDFSAAYNNWDRTDPAELFDAQTKKNESNPKACLTNSCCRG
jgi:hypothetical protein